MKNIRDKLLPLLLTAALVASGIQTSNAASTAFGGLGNGGTYNPATDKLLAIRNGGGPGNPDVKVTLPTSLPPTGTAGGDLSGTYPNPTLATINGQTPAASATTDTTDAGNISSGTLPAARLPAPGASTLGGVQAATATSNMFMTGISTLGVPTKAQPDFGNLSGNIAVSQMNAGTGASSTTVWYGDGTWKTPAGGGTPGGTSGQIQYNNAGGFGGFTLGGDCTVNVGTGALTCTKTGGVSFAPSATTDTTNAANIASGTLPAARLPNPSASTLGGVQSAAAASHQFLTSITTLGVPTLAQPAFTDLSGNISVSQINGGTGASSSTFLRGDNTWATPAGGGSVSVTSASPSIVINPSPGTGTFTIGMTDLLNAQTGTSYTVLSSDIGKTLTNSNSSAIAISLPSPATTGFGAGAAFTDVCLGTGACTITPASSTINGGSSLILHKGGFVYPISDGTNYSGPVFPGFGTIASGSMMKFTADTSGAPTAATAGTDYQAPISLTTTGSSGPATFSGNTLNIPQYSGGGGVSSLNSLTGALNLVAGSNITLTPSGSNITVSASSSASTTLGTSTSAASPQISGDATSGLYTAGAGKVDVAVGGNKIAEWTANGVDVTGTSTANIFNATSSYQIASANGLSFPTADSTAGGSLAIGLGAMQSFSSSAAYKNTAIGYNSMSGTTPTTAAINNTAVGANTMKGNAISGSGNTAIGYSSCQAITSGTNNFCGGFFAGGGITSGQGNVLVGPYAGGNITSGSFNTIFNGAAFTTAQSNTVLSWR